MGSPDSQTGSMPSAVESVVTTNPVLHAAEAKPVAVNSLPVVKPDSTLPVSEPAPVDPEDPHATQPKSDPATDGSEEPHAMKTAATDPRAGLHAGKE